jgi:hypothetical protein
MIDTGQTRGLPHRLADGAPAVHLDVEAVGGAGDVHRHLVAGPIAEPTAVPLDRVVPGDVVGHGEHRSQTPRRLTRSG